MKEYQVSPVVCDIDVYLTFIHIRCGQDILPEGAQDMVSLDELIKLAQDHRESCTERTDN